MCDCTCKINKICENCYYWTQHNQDNGFCNNDNTNASLHNGTHCQNTKFDFGCIFFDGRSM